MPRGSVLGPILLVLYIQPLSHISQNLCMDHQLFADNSQLHRSYQATDFISQTILSVQDCIYLTSKTAWLTINFSWMKTRLKHCFSILQTHLHLCPSARLLSLSLGLSNTSVYALTKICHWKSILLLISFARQLSLNFTVSELFNMIFQLMPLKLFFFHFWFFRLSIASLSYLASHCPWSLYFKRVQNYAIAL